MLQQQPNLMARYNPGTNEVTACACIQYALELRDAIVFRMNIRMPTEGVSQWVPRSALHQL